MLERQEPAWGAGGGWGDALVHALWVGAGGGAGKQPGMTRGDEKRPASKGESNFQPETGKVLCPKAAGAMGGERRG